MNDSKPDDQRLPDFLGIGTMRSGTTTLWQLLERHPRLFLPEQKELHFFDDRDGNFSRGLEWYAGHFADAPPDSVCGEFSPSYLFSEQAAERIRDAMPEARLIVILRDPVERAWSHYWFSVNRGRESLNFEKALERESERLGAGPVPRAWFSYVARGRYLEQLRRFERAFSREQLCVILVEELRSHAEATVEKVFRHLGLDSKEVDLSVEVPTLNREPRPRARYLHYVTMKTRRRNASRFPPRNVPLRLVTGLSTRLNRTTTKPALPPKTKASLVEIFRPHNAALAEWLGRPLPWEGSE